MHIIRLILLTLLLGACNKGHQPALTEPQALKYAELLQLTVCDSFTQVTVKNVWNQGHDLANYVLVPREQPMPKQRPEGIVLRTPLQRAVLHSSVHAALLCDLQAQAAIAGLTDTAYIVSPRLKALFSQGTSDAGSSIQPDLEKLHQLQADAVLVSPFENAGHGVLDRAGVPLIECADYMETSPLGRAEWMRFYGRLFGKAQQADSLFAAIETQYNRLKAQIAQTESRRPTVFCDLRTGGVWYQPGGQSTMGQWIADAGGIYVWANNPKSGGIPLDLESVYAKAHEADIWLIKYGDPTPLTYRQLSLDSPTYPRFSAWKKRQIYSCNTLQIPFYEEVPFHPERLLLNLAAIFHPSSLPGQTMDYYRPMQP